MASTAEGQADGIQPNAGPNSKFDGVSAHPEVDGCSSLAFDLGPHRQPWQTGNTSTSNSPNFVLGNIPD